MSTCKQLCNTHSQIKTTHLRTTKNTRHKFLSSVIWIGWLSHTKHTWLEAKRRNTKKVSDTLTYCCSPAYRLIFYFGHLLNKSQGSHSNVLPKLVLITILLLLSDLQQQLEMMIQYYPHLLGVPGNAYYTITLPQRVCGGSMAIVCLWHLPVIICNVKYQHNLISVLRSSLIAWHSSLTLAWVSNLHTKLLQIAPARNFHGLYHVPFQVQKMSWVTSTDSNPIKAKRKNNPSLTPKQAQACVE